MTTVTTATRICPRCGHERPIADFPRDRSRKSGIYPWCRSCNVDGMRRWRERNPERAKSTARRNGLLRRRGITVAQYDEMLQRQDSACAICGCSEAESTKGVLEVDHDHESGRIRGLLCGRCNLSIGKFDDDVALLRSAIRYLEPSW